MEDVILTPYNEGYKGQLIELYYNCFSHIDQEFIDNQTDKLMAESKNIILATREKELIGLGSFVQLNEFPKDKENAELDLYWSQHPERRDYLEEYYQEYCDEIKKGKVVVEYFKNQFTQEGKEILEKDVYFTNLAVHPKFRRLGIGKLLAEKRISIAKDMGAENIYLNCLEGSGSEELYSK